MPGKVLILGGTGEAVLEARRLAAAGVPVVTSLAGRLATQPDLPGVVRIGGFGGARGLADFLAAEGIVRVIDATHPFAAAISRHARAACAALGLPLERIERPVWPKRPGDHWHWADDPAMAARMAPRLGRRILLTTGAGSLAVFARWGGPLYVVRLIEDPGRLPFHDYRIVLGRGPFSLAAEMALMADFAIDLLVTKASGGAATEAKIAAARRLGVPVLLVRRPA
ncbi:cobalt-precorrin-6A reductase [Telmatospirillum siberiense]|uniref:Cobalt-precorrin-6A reductase n=1 Tax=Telmatospirillum siberiense TaxID=382514 RepID=A0A2N3PMU8_9PROT|nr:cobalt-precorrin-6A reductase [Telmatospirillum siberiense]PKU21728.1 cobalt-precorrin-6A reductase [Telmatospirillum siberiense]